MSNSSLKLLITGGNGQLASALKCHAGMQLFQTLVCARNLLDITSTDNIAQVLQSFKPDVVINTAAYTAVDQAETEQDKALQINWLGAKNLAQVCAQQKRFLIHLSTDYVFDGEKKTPYVETDTPQPINFYGISKLKGEQAVRECADRALVLRVSGLFSQHGQNFLKTILRLALQQDLQIVADQFTCPTNANDLATVIFQLAQTARDGGVYHYCNNTIVSWFDFANMILQIAGEYDARYKHQVTPISALQYQAKAKRPSHAVLSCEKLQRDFGVQQASLTQALHALIPQLIKDQT